MKDDKKRPLDSQQEYICSECGADVAFEDKICPKCGADLSVVEETEPDTGTDKKITEKTNKIIKQEGKKINYSEDFFTGLFKWKMNEEELKNQVENYDTLGFFRSARKVATAMMIFSIIITLIFVMVGWAVFLFSGIDIALVLILTFFVYKGKKWAMMMTMIYWTFSKGLQVVSGLGVGAGATIVVGSVIWWAIFMGVFWQAYQVEKERDRNAIP
ncbi:MAG: hypothetical protein OEZ20_05100 [candidate division WOR-3 bacterium]|nr:hypothetical protein [candidate division WOR-3 bacterium]